MAAFQRLAIARSHCIYLCLIHVHTHTCTVCTCTCNVLLHEWRQQPLNNGHIGTSYFVLSLEILPLQDWCIEKCPLYIWRLFVFVSFIRSVLYRRFHRMYTCTCIYKFHILSIKGTCIVTQRHAHAFIHYTNMYYTLLHVSYYT